MNTVAQQRFLNTVLGLIMAIFGIVFYAGAAFVVLHPPEPTGDPALIDGDIRTCTETLKSLNFVVDRRGDALSAVQKSETFENAERMLEDSSVGISACSLPLMTFCMGPGCAVQGVAFTLSTKVPAVVSRAGSR